MVFIIIEDEISSQELLNSIVKEYCPELVFKGHYSKKKEILKAINTLKPDLIFLDIALEDCNAFDVLYQLRSIEFKIIFTTAYKEYAFKAFEFSAVDYILKPYSPQDVVTAVAKAKKQTLTSNFLEQIKGSIERASIKNLEKITISTFKGLKIINSENIIRLEADGAYCTIHMIDQKSIFASKSLKEMEILLDNSFYFRNHNSHIVNLHQVTEYLNLDGGTILMSNGDQVPLSRRKKADFLGLLKEL